MHVCSHFLFHKTAKKNALSITYAVIHTFKKKIKKTNQNKTTDCWNEKHVNSNPKASSSRHPSYTVVVSYGTQICEWSIDFSIQTMQYQLKELYFQ